MVVKTISSMTLCCAALSGVAYAGDMGSTSTIPDKGFYAGLGGSYHSVTTDRTFDISGTSSVLDDTGVLIATGSTSGPDVRIQNAQSAFSPQVQAGYYQHFANSQQLWGMKFAYQYLKSSANREVNIPQIGIFDSSFTSNNSFTGNIAISSSELNVNHELVLMPYIGHSFTNSFVYLGAGPSLFGTQINHYGMSGTATIEGFPVGFANVPNASSSAWIWGGAAELGLAYYLDPTWILDLSYNYAVTGNYTNTSIEPFSTGIDTVATFGGFVFTDTTQRIISQSFKVSINKVFSL